MNKHIYTVLVFFISVAIHSQETEEKSRFDEISERLNVSIESNGQWYLNDEKFEDFDEEGKIKG